MKASASEMECHAGEISDSFDRFHSIMKHMINDILKGSRGEHADAFRERHDVALNNVGVRGKTSQWIGG